MKQRFSNFIIILLVLILPNILLAQGQSETTSKFPVLKGPYLGQKPPSMVPEIFAPGVISTDAHEGCSAFSKDGQTFIFRRIFSKEKEVILIMKKRSGIWGAPERAPFDSKFYEGDFTFSADGKTLFFSSKRPSEISKPPLKESDIWEVQKTASGWSTPRPLHFPINTKHHEAYPSVAINKNLYFFCRGRGGYGKSDIFISRYKNEIYLMPENLGKIINTSHHEWDPFIASDESYLIFCSTKPDGYGGDDLYISFRKKDSSWSDPKNMGDTINSSASENRPYVTLDNEYLFFTSNKTGNRDIYWVDAKIIEDIKPKKIK